MAEFAKYYVNFLWNALQNIWNFIYSILYAFYKIVVLDTINYFKALGAVVGNFDVLGWICLILVSLVNIALVFFIVYRLVQLIRRYIVYRGKEVEKDKLMEEIARLHEQAEELVKEKNQIFALKVGNQISEGYVPNDALAVTSDEGTGGNREASRFTKLINLDEKYGRNPNIIFMSEYRHDLLAGYREKICRFRRVATPTLLFRRYDPTVFRRPCDFQNHYFRGHLGYG